MSAPIGYLKAELYGLPFTFNGNDWTCPEIPEELKIFLDYTVSTLHSELSRRGIHYHTPLGIRAEMMLEYSLGPSDGWNWKIVEERPSPDWDKPLPPGWID
ncbi:MAG: hypothetical protein OJI67_19945 [Prosthecobacter sp.]|nr:hypothetical protein [Prosthecobacter sp.]